MTGIGAGEEERGKEWRCEETRQTESDPSRCSNIRTLTMPTDSSLLPPVLTYPPFSDRDPLRANAMVHYLLNAWHSTMLAKRLRELLLMRRTHT